MDADDLRRALEALVGVPATSGNRVEALRNGDEIFPAMLDAIQAAESSIDLLTFIYWTGDIARRFADALSERARAGVRVRVILDALGCRRMDPALVTKMTDAGAKVHWFRPPTEWKVWETEHRTHRKILVCDETVGFTGGVGIAEEWEGDARDETEWRDTHFMIEGPAVAGLRGGFNADWVEGDASALTEGDRFPELPQAGDLDVLVVRGAAEYGWNDMVLLKRALLELAEERIRITTPYFSPDDATADLLIGAADRGVDVHVLMPGPHIDKRVVQLSSEEKYPELLEAGVRISRFQPSMLHAKVITVDGVLADVGSANLNSRSLAHDEEIDVVVFDDGFTAELDAHFDDDLRRSEDVEPDDWSDRGAGQRLAENAVSLVDDLL